jgi:hypothetical protein
VASFKGGRSTPSHVNASFTAAIVVRSLLAAERSAWRVGLLVFVDRRVVCWPVSLDVVVVAVDMGFLSCC